MSDLSEISSDAVAAAAAALSLPETPAEKLMHDLVVLVFRHGEDSIKVKVHVVVVVVVVVVLDDCRLC